MSGTTNRSHNEIDADIDRVSADLRRCLPQHRRRLQHMLDCLLAERLGVPPPPEPPEPERAPPPYEPEPHPGPENDYNPQEWLRCKWDYIYQNGSQTFSPTRFDDRGYPITEDEHGRTYEDQFIWGPPHVIAAAEVYASARCGRPDRKAVDPSLRWEATYDAIEDRIRAERGGLISDKVLAERQRWSAMDPCAPSREDEHYTFWPRRR
jgi:hypothetical protein